MPLLRVEMLSGRSREQKRELAQVLTREMARIGGCAEDHVQVIFTEVERHNWAVGGVLNDPQVTAQS